jgi:hypothetical protein
MGLLDKPLRKVTATVYGKLGRPMTLRKETGTTYDPATGTNVPTYTPYPVKGRSDRYDKKLIDGTLIKSSDRHVTFPAADLPSGVEPVQGDEWIIGDTTYLVHEASPTDATEEAVYWELQVRA